MKPEGQPVLFFCSGKTLKGQSEKETSWLTPEQRFIFSDISLTYYAPRDAFNVAGTVQCMVQCVDSGVELLMFLLHFPHLPLLQRNEQRDSITWSVGSCPGCLVTICQVYVPSLYWTESGLPSSHQRSQAYCEHSQSFLTWKIPFVKFLFSRITFHESISFLP